MRDGRPSAVIAEIIMQLSADGRYEVVHYDTVSVATFAVLMIHCLSDTTPDLDGRNRGIPVLKSVIHPQ